MERILIIRLSSMGDIILSTPLIRAVRRKYPNATIDFLVKSKFQSLLTHNPHITKLISFDKEKDDIKDLKQEIKKAQYDWIIDIHRNFRSYYLTRGVGAKLITRHRKYILKRQLLVWFGINTYSGNIPVLERYFEASDVKGISYDGNGTEIFYNDNEMVLVNDFLRTNGVNDIDNVVAICPGASFANKRWLPDRFALVADEMSRRENTVVILMGGPEDVELSKEIQGLMESKAIIAAGELSLLGSAALLSKVNLVVSNDTGLMHLAQSQGAPVVAIFGPTTQELGYYPIPNNSAVVEASVSCRPCTHNGLDKCPKGHFKCMNDITEAMVSEASAKLLKAN